MARLKSFIFAACFVGFSSSCKNAVAHISFRVQNYKSFSFFLP